MRLRILLLVNASASSVTARARVVIQKALAADHDVTVSETSRRGHASRLAQGAAAQGTDVVVVLGGDGTLNEAANGLAGTQTALGVLPGGSTNVFARTIGMTDDPIEATGQLLVALAHRSTRRIALGNVNGRYFLFHVGMGFDAAVVARVERRGSLKRYAGHPLFVYATVATWLRHYDRSRPRFAVSIQEANDGRNRGRPDASDGTDGVHEPPTGRGRSGKARSGSTAGGVIDDAYFAVCLKTNPYTFLGHRPLDVAPWVGLDSGLSMVTFRSLELPTLLGLTVSALRGGAGVERHRRVSIAREIEGATVTGYGPIPYQVDGDYLGEAEQLNLSTHRDALTLVLPQPEAAQ